MPSDVFNPEICFDTPVGRMCIPILSGPTFPLPPAESRKPDVNRTDMYAAMGAGHAHASIFRKLRREFEAAGRDRKAFAKRLIAQFKEDDQIRESEERDLMEIVEIIFGGEHSSTQVRLRGIYERIIDQHGTPLAIALAGIAADSAAFVAETGATEGPILVADFMGGVVGGSIGGVVGAGAIGGTASFLAWW